MDIVNKIKAEFKNASGILFCLSRYYFYIFCIFGIFVFCIILITNYFLSSVFVVITLYFLFLLVLITPTGFTGYVL